MHSSCSEMKMIIWSFCLILSLSNSILVFASPSAKHLCRSDQRDALLEFKTEFDTDADVMSPSDKKTERWKNYVDCCSWEGISCDPKTGMVVELLLFNSSLNGSLRYNSSLFRLSHLQILDLGRNYLSGILPDSIRKLRYLRVLNLRYCNFFGNIPSSLGNLSYLTHLYLFDNFFTGELPDSIGDLNQLTELQLESNELSGKFKPMLLNLSELTLINLGYNQFEGMLPSNMSSFSKLVYFAIMANSFSGSFPSSLLMIPSLACLELTSNNFNGPLDLEFGNISATSTLDCLFVGENNFSGPIPRSISKLVALSYLDLSFWNTERGMVDFNIFLYLKMLRQLDLSYLNTRSVVELSLFSNLTLLGYLDLSGNVLGISSTLYLPSPLLYLVLSSCNIVEFPNFLQNQTSLSELDISANHIEGHVPEWLWRLPQLRDVNISQNFLSGFEGSLDVLQKSGVLSILDISSNKFQGPFPLLPNSTLVVFASDNQFSGEIPRSICGLLSLRILVLSNNNITGSIPRCFENFKTTLWVLHLQKNSLSGTFPDEAIGHHLRSLDLGHNKFSGELPKSLMNCTRLDFLNVEDNKFNDTFPFWIRLLHNLEILVLRSNEFHGPIYSSRDSMSFPMLRIFDISENHFNGVLPLNYFQGWTAMASSVVDIVDDTFAYERSYHKQVDLTIKGSKMELVWSSFTIYKTIDISGNNLTGNIPESIGLLMELIVLNMSNNAFTGHIPQSLANLTNLQSLDVSQNRLSGKIPPDLSKLTFLSRMNFSCNRLEGPIPIGTQIQSQNSSSFAENPDLCGLPLQEVCGRREEETDHQEDNAERVEKDQVLSWIAAAIGYVPGVFCGLIIAHIFNA